MPPTSTHQFPPEKINRYRKILARVERGEGAERNVAAALLAKLEDELPGLGVAAARVDARDRLLEELRKRGFPTAPPRGNNVPHYPDGDVEHPSPRAPWTERLFRKAVNRAADYLAENVSPEELLDAVETATGFEVRGRKRKQEPPMANQTQAERIREALDTAGEIDVVFLIEAGKPPEAEPVAVEVTLTLPVDLLTRLAKTKATASTLADWILCAIEDASLAEPEPEPEQPVEP